MSLLWETPQTVPELDTKSLRLAPSQRGALLFDLRVLIPSLKETIRTIMRNDKNLFDWLARETDISDGRMMFSFTKFFIFPPLALPSRKQTDWIPLIQAQKKKHEQILRALSTNKQNRRWELTLSSNSTFQLESAKSSAKGTSPRTWTLRHCTIAKEISSSATRW